MSPVSSSMKRWRAAKNARRSSLWTTSGVVSVAHAVGLGYASAVNGIGIDLSKGGEANGRKAPWKQRRFDRSTKRRPMDGSGFLCRAGWPTETEGGLWPYAQGGCREVGVFARGCAGWVDSP